jgi:hypothetical protein
MDRSLMLLHHLLGLPGMLAAMGMLVIDRNAFGTISSVLVHKEG